MMGQYYKWVTTIVLCAVRALVWAQSWLSKLVRIIVLAIGGSNVGLLARTIAGRVRALRANAVRERLAKPGTVPMSLLSEQFDKLIREEVAANAALVKAAGIRGNYP